ncbi:hypothetical protein ERJ75_001172600 [Trypanosoma vivax]|nr:hypothetical protein ERJ75_001172600 [Trypanosoma vivax]
MILQFNWDRLDVTAAEAICALINAKLEEQLALHRDVAADAVGDCSTEVGDDNLVSGVESLCVTSIDWGNVPPFVEVLQIDNAVEFGTPVPPSSESLRGMTEANVPHSGSGGGTSFRLLSSSASSAHFCENSSDGDSGVPATGAGVSLPSTAQGAVPRTGNTPCVGEVAEESDKDAFAAFVGPGGLYVCLHVTYGGPMCISMSCLLRHDIALGPTSLPVRMPLQLHLSRMDMDFYLCINLHRNTCRLWMEPGKLSSSPITRMSVRAVFGERGYNSQRSTEYAQGLPSGTDEMDVSDARTHLGSSHVESEDVDDTVFIDESVISQFALAEVRAILQEKIVYPHSIVVPVFT